MLTVKECVEIMRTIAPEEYTYEYDNVGLLVGTYAAEVKRIMCCLDVTNDVLDEAVVKDVQLIISHHPMLFSPIKRVISEDTAGRKIIKAIEHKINIYAAHTNLDFVTDGINEYAAKLLGLEELTPIDPYIGQEQGFGRIGVLNEKIDCLRLRDIASKAYSDDFVRIIGDEKREVRKIAVINGAGGGDTAYIDMALKSGADCLVTADVKHHVAIYGIDNKFTIIEPQHYSMEYCYIGYLVEKLRKAIEEKEFSAEVISSESNKVMRK